MMEGAKHFTAGRAVRWIGTACFMLFAACIQAATVTATVDRQTVTLGEAVTLSISFDGAQVNQPGLPTLPNFQLVGTGSSFSLDAVRGVAQQVFTYQLAP